jgi:hypothetical protein
VAASTPYVLVDLSDVTNFPHGKTQEIHLLGLILDAEKASDGVFDLWVGVVIENDGTDGSVEWVHVFHMESVANPTDSTDRFYAEIDFTLGGSNPDGLNCAVVDGATPWFAGNQSQADNGSWQNDTNRVSPVGSTTKPGVGDLVVWAEEVTDGGTLDFSITAIYTVA